MNRTKLKNYAPAARREFIHAVTDRAAFYGLAAGKTEPVTERGDVAIIAGRPHPHAVADKRRKLEERIKRQGFEQTMEAVGYSWFNRFVAIRYMELHGYLEHGYRVLSHPEGKLTPEIVEHAEHVEMPGLSRQKVIELKLDGNKEPELYRMLLIAQCNALSEAMPFLFGRIDDESELLLPDNLLHSDSLIRKLASEIDEADWQEVEIIGWLYQFYISEKKAEVIGKVVKSEDIPAATQLFTPNWIVKYLVQNSIGRQWLATYPDSPLRSKMEYYIEPAEQTPEVRGQLAAITPESLNPEEMTLLDPACGSGHILVEAYDLFKAIYQERGYRAKDIPRLILSNNLFGLEIDERAAQLAGFALCMKARADDRRALEGGVPLDVRCIQSSDGLDAEGVYECLTGEEPEPAPPGTEFGFMDPIRTPLFARRETTQKKQQAGEVGFTLNDVKTLLALFEGESAKTFGSLIRIPEALAASLRELARRTEAIADGHDMYRRDVAARWSPIIEQSAIMVRRYDAVITNPPYLGMRAMNAQIRSFGQEVYPAYKLDTYALFVARCLQMTKPTGTASLVTMHSWMFLHRFEAMRQDILTSHTLFSLAHLGAKAFSSLSGEVVQACAFALSPHPAPAYLPSFIRCVDGEEEDKQCALVQKRNLYQRFSQESFLAIEGGILAYWVSPKVMSLFHNCPRAESVAAPRHGMVTSDNDRFLRYWWEVSLEKIGFGYDSRAGAARSGKKWFPYNKGGSYRKWYGNMDLLINWEHDGREVIDFARQLYGSPSRKIQAQEYYFRAGVTWSALSGTDVSMRANGPGFLFDSKGSSMFFDDEDTLYAALAVYNSAVASQLLNVMAPTLDFSAGAMAHLPLPASVIKTHAIGLARTARQCVAIAQTDWNALETSWDFRNPSTMWRQHVDVGSACVYARQYWADRRQELRTAEEEINRRCVEAYELDGEIRCEPLEEQISVRIRTDADCLVELISYAIGCTMGRYSLDKTGLIYVHSGNQDFDSNAYKTFPADKDGIVPVMEADWFADDAAHRVEEFVKVAWPAEHLEDNLAFIAESLGAKKGEPPRETIRRYLACDFFKDHLRTYKRRPIYWLFSSGKQRAFQCLVYLHRYHEGTLSRMRTEYVIPLQGKIDARIASLADEIAKAGSTSHRRKLEKERDTLLKQQAELLKFDEKLRHYAEMKISLDLDDGVKVNYAKFCDPKFGDLLAEVKAVCGTKEEE